MARLMDAALGTALMAHKIDPLYAPLTHADAVAAIHASHVAAGAEAVLTATFQANPITLAEERLLLLGRAAVRLARSSKAAMVLGSVGPIMTPGSSREFADLWALALTLEALEDTDAVLLETCSSPASLEAAAFAFHRHERVVWLSITYHRVDGRLVTFSGHGPEVFARHARRHGVAALGVNCGKAVSPADCAAIVRIYRQETDLPLFARPNAGTPEEFAAAGIEADWVGGCCGTTSAHLEALGTVAGRRDEPCRRRPGN